MKAKKYPIRSLFAPLLSGYRFALLAVAIVTLLALPLRDHYDPVNLVMFYLIGVVAVAVRAGTGPSVFASIIAVAAFNFFFTEPYYSLLVYDTSYIFTFSVMLMTSLVIGSMTAHLRLQAESAKAQTRQTQALYALTRALAGARGREAIIHTAGVHITSRFPSNVLIRLNDEPEWDGDLKERSAALWAMEHGAPAGHGTNTLTGAHGFYLPLMTEGETVGVIGIMRPDDAAPLSTEEHALLETYTLLVASALLRTRKSEQAEKSKIEMEAEKLRNMLLSSVSHDLRTPLASVRGSIEAVLESSRPALSADAIELLETAHRQSERLTRMVSDLLDINRLETGSPLLNRQPYYIDEIIGAAISHVKPWLGGRALKARIEPHLPLVTLDGALIEQVIVNLLENAVKYTPHDGTITITAEKRPHHLYLSVSDNGCGIPPGEEMKIFEKFYRVANNPTQGSGLGLAICKAIVGAHSGSINAGNNESGGMSVMMTLPLEATHG